MIKQVFHVEDYWKVIVFYNVDYNLFTYIEKEMAKGGFTYNDINSLYDNMHDGNARAVTCSNESMHLSIVLFNNHTSTSDYLNSIVHEAEHIKQAMLNAYDVEDRGEPPAYTIGYLVGRMWEVFRRIVQ